MQSPEEKAYPTLLTRFTSGNARLAGLEQDLNMTPGDYALALSLFFVSYNLCEVVSHRTPLAWHTS